MLVAADLAEALRSEMGFSGPVSEELLGWATGFVSEITLAATHSSAPGNISGTCPPVAGPLIDGAGSNGVIAGITGPSLANRVFADVPYPGSVTEELSNYSEEITGHIKDSGNVSFSSGNVTGITTNTLLSPGALTLGQAANGAISTLSGATLADRIKSAMGYGAVSVQLLAFCTALVGYLESEGEPRYAIGQVVGVAPAGGGALTGGAGSAGTIV